MSSKVRNRRAIAVLVAAFAGAALVGCELVAEFDRSKIPQAGDGSVADVATDQTTDNNVTPDGGDAGDAATTDASDASTTDASDAGEGGTTTDAGDGGSTDAGDDGATSDAGDGGGDAGLVVNGCGEAQFAANDARDAGTPVISFPDDAGANMYQPKCVRISVNQSVTFRGDFTMHPLQQQPNTAGSPLPLNGSAYAGDGGAQPQDMTYLFNQAGTFGYECSVHGAGGMNGAVDVVP
jgi:plastocyanin